MLQAIFQKIEVNLARFAIFIVYFWFGALKLIGLSPASQLVQSLFEKTISFLPFGTFYIFFALFEIAIGIIFLVKGLEKIGILFLGVHLIMAMMPLFLLPSITWLSFLTPTLEGQYIIKNILIISTAAAIGAHSKSAKI